MRATSARIDVDAGEEIVVVVGRDRDEQGARRAHRARRSRRCPSQLTPMWWTLRPPSVSIVRAVRVRWLSETLSTKRTLRSALAIPALRMRPFGSDSSRLLPGCMPSTARQNSTHVSSASVGNPRAMWSMRPSGASTAGPGCVAAEVESAFEYPVRAERRIDEIDHAAVRRRDRGQRRLLQAHRAVESCRLQRRGALERAQRIVGGEADRADRRAVFDQMRARKRMRIGVEDQVDAALPVQREVLGAMLSGAPEAELLAAPRRAPARTPRRRRIRETRCREAASPPAGRTTRSARAPARSPSPSRRPLRRGLEARAHLAFEIEQRAHRILGRAPVRRLAEDVVEDLERQRPGVAGAAAPGRRSSRGRTGPGRGSCGSAAPIAARP